MYDVNQPQSNWTKEELAGFNIEIREVTEQGFFGRGWPSEISFDANGTNHLDDGSILAVIGRLDYLMRHYVDEEQCLDNMASDLHLILGSETDGTITRTREKLWLSMSRELVAIKTDACILDANSKVLLIVQNGTLSRETPSDPEAHLIAASIAAFQLNNRKRQNAIFQEVLTVETIPGIIMVGGTPTFYKTLVSNTLDMAVQVGELPSRKTVVYKYCPIKPVYPAMLRKEEKEKVSLAFRAFMPFVLRTTTQGVDPKDCTVEANLRNK
ncbi:hypothetical protein Clacol_004813 [Clathrus columnatus]|uniref:Profilin n=1 Tax=Clathrus columnatus TaxID=1419009 RepID=A0AAV5AC38_9AGAM|nr:hypothetical protein Clacol_004813 [Clathrus columnatus]